MGLFSFRGQATPAADGQGVTPEQIIEKIHALQGAQSVRIDTKTTAGQTQAYELCGAVRVVIGLLCQYIRQFKLYQADSRGKEIDGTQYIDKIITPNPYQTLADFVASVELCAKLYGRAFIWRDTANGGDLYVLPNVIVEEESKTGRAVWTKPDGDIDGYRLTIYGQRVPLVFDDVYVLHDTSLNMHKIVTGQSRLYGASDLISASVAANQATAQIIAQRGPLGIVSMLPPDAAAGIADKKQKEDAERKLTRKYGLMGEQFRYIVTSWDSRFTPITANIDDLHIEENRKEAREEIARLYGVPTVLLDTGGTTFANLSTAERSLYQNVIFADAQAIFEKINHIRGLNTVKVLPYYNHLPCFQSQRREEAQAFTTYANALHTLFVDGVITQEEYRRKLSNFDINE